MASAILGLIVGALIMGSPDLGVNASTPVTRVSWAFNGGSLHGKPVLDTLRDYLRHVGELVEAAERKLVP